MNNLRNLILVLLLLCFNASTVYADSPYFIDFKYILNESEAGKKAQNSLKSKLDKGIKTFKKKKKKFKKKKKKS